MNLTHTDYTLIGLGILAALLFVTTAVFWRKSEDLQEDLAFERFEHENTKEDLQAAEARTERVVLDVAPVLVRTAWSFGMSTAQMRAAEVQRNEQIDRVKAAIKVTETGKKLLDSKIVF
ncbi:hypothetical protein [Terracoccus sp. 273MFTsu3.1]|uniref:hypothetical protein n=1 Tax=Terracoccus sp. 273MFTsu3.1 TaxID=1172188 RepID=UPI0003735F7D|nr:hypothetical protein [Terracoccus sp. 273MFTsu3.1]